MNLQEYFLSAQKRQADLAKDIGAHHVVVSQWANGRRRVPAEYCPAIERATNGAVRCEELRPDVDWAYLRKSGSMRRRKEALPT